jgi:hypothetical protein
MFKTPSKGDRVLHYGRRAVVTSVYFNGRGDRICEIEYEDLTNGIDYDEVLSDSLIVIDENEKKIKTTKKKYWVDPDKACPFCETPWTVTKFGRNVWYDCKPCKKTKEKIDKED